MTPENARRPYQNIVAFMLEKLSDSGVLTDLAPGSVARTMVEATAREFSELYARMNAVYDAGFIDTATGASLDQLVALVGITRVDGAAEIAEVTLTRDSRITARVIIPAGSQIAVLRVQADDKVIYTVDDDYEMREGENTLVIGMHALPDLTQNQTAADVALSQDDADNGTVTQLRPIAGIAGLALVGPSVSLGIRESDEQLRKRAKMAIASAGGGTAKALENALMGIAEIKSVHLRDASDLNDMGQPYMPPGELEIVLETSDADLIQNEAEITAAIEAHKGPGILARVRATATQVLSGNLVIRPASGALTGAQTLKLIADCTAVLTAQVDGMGIGGTLTWNRLLAGLMGVENVADVVTADSSLRLSGSPPATSLGDITLPPFTRLNLGEGVEAVAITLEEIPLVSLELVLSPPMQEPTSAEITALTDNAVAVLDAVIDGLNALAPTQPRTLNLTDTIAQLAGPEGLGGAVGASLTANTTRLNVLDMIERSAVALTGANTTMDVAAGTLVTLAATPVRFEWEPATP